MARPKDEWQNAFVYEGWILEVEGPTRRPDGLHIYRLRVGFSREEQIRVLAFRRAPSERLVRGAPVRVRGQFRFLPDDTGRVHLKLDAVDVRVRTDVEPRALPAPTPDDGENEDGA